MLYFYAYSDAPKNARDEIVIDYGWTHSRMLVLRKAWSVHAKLDHKMRKLNKEARYQKSMTMVAGKAMKKEVVNVLKLLKDCCN